MISMSISGLSSNPNTKHKNSLHRSHDSGELDVFQAAQYFSSVNPGYDTNAANCSRSFIREDQRLHLQRPARISLDNMPMRFPMNNPPICHHVMDHKEMKSENSKKCKQPSSPGSRLASFLNSLFSQTPLKKKKKKKSKSGGTTRDFDEESPGGTRKRSTSISHFIITSNKASLPANSSLYSSSSSGVRTPPPHANTPSKLYKEFRNIFDQRQAKKGGNVNELCAEKRGTDHGAWMEEKSRIKNGVPEKILKYGKSTKNRGDDCPLEVKEFRKFSDADDGGDSDSSSDLFDLPNLDLGFYSSGLPVYETTHMDRIKIANATRV